MLPKHFKRDAVYIRTYISPACLKESLKGSFESSHFTHIYDRACACAAQSH